MTDANVADWFSVLDENVDEAEQTEEEPELSGIHASFVRKLRELVPTWQSVDVRPGGSFAGLIEDRVWAAAYITDRQANTMIGCVRVEISEAEWVASWVSPAIGTETYFEDADPNPSEQTGGTITDPEQGVAAAVDWMETQLRRPVKRYIWRSGGQPVAEYWRLEDTGRGLVMSGPREKWSNPETADEVIDVRP